MVHLVLGVELHAVAGRPAVELTLRPSAEPQQLGPELLNEEHQTGDTFLLRLIGAAEGHAGNVDVQTAGIGAVAVVIQLLCLVEHCRPWHFMQVVVQRHGMGHELQTVVQTAVRLDVQIDRSFVCGLQQTVGIRTALAAVVNLKLHTELAQALSVEDQLGHIVVFVDRPFHTGIIIAIPAKVFAVVFIDVFNVDERAAAVTGGVVAFSAAMA